MELIERYLNEVGRRLPKAKRDDIRKELRSTLDDALEGRGAGERSEEDVIAVLQEFGAPEVVATSYSGDRYLIGPKLYPPFKTTLRIVITVLASLVVLGAAVSALGDTHGLAEFAQRVGGLVNGLFDSALTSIGIVVLVFAILERLDVGDELRPKDKTKWDPRKLPAVRDVDLVGRFDSIAEVVFPAVILIGLNQFRDRVGFFFMPPDKLFLNDVFLDNLPWINTSLLLSMALGVWLFWSGRWHWSSRFVKIASSLFGLFVFHRICQGILGGLGELSASGVPAVAVKLIEQFAEHAPILVAILILIGAVKHLFRAYKSLS